MSDGTIDFVEPRAFLSPEDVEDLREVDACRQLYKSIIELAVHDYRFLQRMSRSSHTSTYDRKKLRQMTEDGDPQEFFEGTWVEQVCDYLGANPQLIRERLESESESCELDDLVETNLNPTESFANAGPTNLESAGSLDVSDLPHQVGDVFFHDGMYYIGEEDSPVRGKVRTSTGALLVYLLNHIEKPFTFEGLAGAFQWSESTMRVALHDMYLAINRHSDVFTLDRERQQLTTYTYVMHSRS